MATLDDVRVQAHFRHAISLSGEDQRMMQASKHQSLSARAMALLLVLAATSLTGAARAADDSGSGLPVPRFVSLKADKVNVRTGPNKDQDVSWIFSRAGLPVEITAEFETWRRIRDVDGSEGWVYHSMLSGRRTALVSPWLKSGTAVLHERADPTARATAQLEPRVLASVKSCDGKWCRITGPGFDGFIEQGNLWGVYPGEKVE